MKTCFFPSGIFLSMNEYGVGTSIKLNVCGDGGSSVAFTVDSLIRRVNVLKLLGAKAIIISGAEPSFYKKDLDKVLPLISSQLPVRLDTDGTKPYILKKFLGISGLG